MQKKMVRPNIPRLGRQIRVLQIVFRVEQTGRFNGNRRFLLLQHSILLVSLQKNVNIRIPLAYDSVVILDTNNLILLLIVNLY